MRLCHTAQQECGYEAGAEHLHEPGPAVHVQTLLTAQQTYAWHGSAYAMPAADTPAQRRACWHAPTGRGHARSPQQGARGYGRERIEPTERTLEIQTRGDLQDLGTPKRCEACRQPWATVDGMRISCD